MDKKQGAGKDKSPINYIGKRGLAYIEVLALLDEINEWRSKGFPMVSIYKMYVDTGKVSKLYKFGSFRRAVLKALSTHEANQGQIVDKRGVESGKVNRSVRPGSGGKSELFPMPEGDFIND